MKRTKKTRIAAGLLALALLAGLGWFANSLVGNPISRHLVNRRAQTYLAETYPDTDYQRSPAAFSFKDGSYYVRVNSPSSQDSAFSLTFSADGRLRYDDFEERVTNRRNTIDRLSQEYRERVQSALEGLPFEAELCGGDLWNAFFPEGQDPAPGTVPEPWDRTTLELDAHYDLRERGARHGQVTLWVRDQDVSFQRSAEILLDVRARLDAAGLPFRAMDFRLCPPRGEDDAPEDPREISLQGLAWEDIYPEGLEERVEENAAATAAFLAELDAQKDAELAASAP